MALMTVRATYSLDAETTKTIGALAKRWQTSQAEVVRRSVKLAAEQVAAEPAPMTPADVIAHYRQHGLPRSWTEMKKIIAAQRRERHEDDVERLSRTTKET